MANEIDDLKIESLSDDDLESVAGGLAEGSCSCCEETSGCTSLPAEEEVA